MTNPVCNADASQPEILAPAGQPEAGYAALHYGADAVYLGLDRFSARAEAANFTPDELSGFTAYAHSLSPRRRVYLALNTLVKDAELPEAAETLFVAAECGIDAIIVQDLGVAALARKYFPGFPLHASTQMAIHNLDGVLAAKDLGCSRVVLARELTLAELKPLVAAARENGLEIETFIHGTLCYSYSGLCLFSSIATGRSGNRGRCVYSCREAADTPAGRAHPFSLKDMALGERVLDLARLGVASLKIEGRKKSPLYVAATVDYYRRLLDGAMTPESAAEAEDRLKTIFARPWTRLFLDGRRNPGAADPEVVGHRGAPLGVVKGVVKTPAGPGVAFRARLPLERHDGIQIDIPGQARPFGFPVDNLYVSRGRGKGVEPVFVAPAGGEAIVALPADAPPLAPGLPLYQSSSQAVKRSYPYFRPKAGAFSAALPMAAALGVEEAAGPDGERLALIAAEAEAFLPEWMCEAESALAREEAAEALRVRVSQTAPAFPARDAAGAEKAARDAFARTGGSGFRAESLRFANPDGLFVRPGEWNRLRRDVLEALAERHAARRNRLLEALREASRPDAPPLPAAAGDAAGSGLRWSLFADDATFLSRFEPEDFAGCEEIVLGMPLAEPGDGALDGLAHKVGRERVRIAAPLVNRDAPAVGSRIEKLWAGGWRRWMVPGLWAWRALAGRDGLDMSADWPLHVLNRLTAGRLMGMGFSGFTLSPEDDIANLTDLPAGYADRACLVVYSDLPLFISAACAHAHLGLCGNPGSRDLAAGCRDAGKPLRVSMEKSGRVEIWPQACGSIVVGERPYALSGVRELSNRMAIRRLRVDLRWRRYSPDEALRIWRRMRSGGEVAGVKGNLERGLQ